MDTNRLLGAVERAVTSADFTEPGGYLVPQQQQLFFQYIRDPGNPLLNSARLRQMVQKREDIDKMHLGRPVTRAATESGSVAFHAEPQFGRTVRLSAEKLQASWERTRDIDIQQIEGPGLAATVMDALSKQFARDLENLAINGDSSISATDEVALLRKSNDGWLKLADEGAVISAAGAGPNYDLFEEAYLRLPSMHASDPGMKWLWNPAARIRLARSLQGRPDAVGAEALQGRVNGPMGIPFMDCGYFPRQLSVSSLAAATPAQLRSPVSGPFYVTSTAKNLKLTVAGTTVTVDLSTALKNSVAKGPVTANEAAKVINAALVASALGATYANAAKDDGDGYLLITGVATGAATHIIVNSGGAPANDASGIFGFTGTEDVTGGDAASGVKKNGSVILLTNPMNLIYGVVGRARVSTFYQQITDTDQVVMYTWADFAIEETDALVKIKDVLV